MKQLMFCLAASLSLVALADTAGSAKSLASGEKDGMRFAIAADAAALRIEVAFDEPKAGQKDEIVRGIEAILKRIRTLSPKTKILVYGILPRGKTWPKDGTAPTVNARLAKLADGKTLFFRDIAASYLKEDGVTVRGELFRDGLHPNEAGNDKWVDSILPALDEILR